MEEQCSRSPSVTAAVCRDSPIPNLKGDSQRAGGSPTPRERLLFSQFSDQSDCGSKLNQVPTDGYGKRTAANKQA